MFGLAPGRSFSVTRRKRMSRGCIAAAQNFRSLCTVFIQAPLSLTQLSCTIAYLDFLECNPKIMNSKELFESIIQYGVQKYQQAETITM